LDGFPFVFLCNCQWRREELTVPHWKDVLHMESFYKTLKTNFSHPPLPHPGIVVFILHTVMEAVLFSRLFAAFL
jgi:hypothetical protein